MTVEALLSLLFGALLGMLFGIWLVLILILKRANRVVNYLASRGMLSILHAPTPAHDPPVRQNKQLSVICGLLNETNDLLAGIKHRIEWEVKDENLEDTAKDDEETI